jgi:hypothetical protein
MSETHVISEELGTVGKVRFEPVGEHVRNSRDIRRAHGYFYRRMPVKSSVLLIVSEKIYG